MSKTLIDLDDDLIARAAEFLGTKTKKDTVNGALAEYVKLNLRIRFGEPRGRRAGRARRAGAGQGQHRTVAIPDLIIAGVAERPRVRILRYSRLKEASPG